LTCAQQENSSEAFINSHSSWAFPSQPNFTVRYYDAGLGRFVGRDPLGTAHDINMMNLLNRLRAGIAYQNGMSLYGAYFVVNGVDPSGMYWGEDYIDSFLDTVSDTASEIGNGVVNAALQLIPNAIDVGYYNGFGGHIGVDFTTGDVTVGAGAGFGAWGAVGTTGLYGNVGGGTSSGWDIGYSGSVTVPVVGNVGPNVTVEGTYLGLGSSVSLNVGVGAGVGLNVIDVSIPFGEIVSEIFGAELSAEEPPVTDSENTPCL